jgi:hypothetical protein
MNTLFLDHFNVGVRATAFSTETCATGQIKIFPHYILHVYY